MPERKTKKRKFSFALLLQMLISIGYGALLIHMTVVLLIERNSGWIVNIISYFSQLVVIIASIVFLFILRLRHRTHSIDSTLLPLLFSFIALESTAILPLYSAITGIMLLPPNAVIIIERFAVFSAAIVFAFSAVQYYGTNASRLKLYLTIAIAAAFYLALAAPINTGNESLANLRVFTSQYDTYLMITLSVIYIMSIITYIAAVIKDRASHSVARAVAFILLMIGNYLVISTDLATSIVAAVSYITGIILLSSTSKNTF